MDLFPSASHARFSGDLNRFTASEVGFDLDSDLSNHNFGMPNYSRADFLDLSPTRNKQGVRDDDGEITYRRRQQLGSRRGDHTSDGAEKSKPSRSKYSSLYDDIMMDDCVSPPPEPVMKSQPSRRNPALAPKRSGLNLDFGSNNASNAGNKQQRPAGSGNKNATGGAAAIELLNQDPLGGLKRKVIDLTASKDLILRNIKVKEEQLKKFLLRLDEKNDTVKSMQNAILKVRERLAERETEAGDLDLKLREKQHLLKNFRDENEKHSKSNKLHIERLQKLQEASKTAQREIAAMNGKIGTLKAGLDVQLQGTNNNLHSVSFGSKLG